MSLHLEQVEIAPETLLKDDWLDQYLIKSNSQRTRSSAVTATNLFECFCKDEGIKEEKLIEKYQAWAKNDDIQSVCVNLMKFIGFLSTDHDDIILNQKNTNARVKCKKKHPKTIQTYFTFVKSYLRKCYRIRITVEDVNDYMQLPRIPKEPRKAIPIKILKLIFNKAEPEQKALYSTLISSGMRIGEALQLTKEDFHFNENPVRVSIREETTKTGEARETYISREAVEKLLPIIEKKKEGEKVFTEFEDKYEAVVREDQYFRNLRIRLGITETYKSSRNFIYTIHSFRAYFHTKASQKHGVEYANALDGHGAYLKQYYRETPEERASKYKELEPSLLIEKYQVEDKNKDKTIENLQSQMQKLQEEMLRYKLLKNIST